jgi:hypothetical protein
MVYGRTMTSTKHANSLRRLPQLAAAAVWLHQGLWCKVLGRDPAHRDVVASVPGLAGRRATLVATGLGLGETALALMVATNGHRRRVAAVETTLVAAFNAGGLLLGRQHIAHPARLLARNGAFVALIWSSVDGRHNR